MKENNIVKVPVSLYRLLIQATNEAVIHEVTLNKKPEDEIEVTRRELMAMIPLIVKHPEESVSSYYLNEITRLLKENPVEENPEKKGPVLKKVTWPLEQTKKDRSDGLSAFLNHLAFAKEIPACQRDYFDDMVRNIAPPSRRPDKSVIDEFRKAMKGQDEKFLRQKVDELIKQNAVCPEETGGYFGVGVQSFQEGIDGVMKNSGVIKNVLAPVEIRTAGGYFEDGNLLLEMVYLPKEKKTMLAKRWKSGMISLHDQVDVAHDPKIHRYLPLPPDNPLMRFNKVGFAAAMNQNRTVVDIVSRIRDLIYRYADVEPWFENFLAWWVVYTWLHDSYRKPALVLHLHGSARTGKSQLLRVLRSICYRPLTVLSVRELLVTAHWLDEHQVHPTTLFLDTMIGQDPEQVFRILDNDAVGRMIGAGTGFRQGLYNFTGPKMAVTRHALKDLPQHCVTYRMRETGRRDIPISWNDTEFEEKTARIRDALLYIRMKHSAPARYGFAVENGPVEAMVTGLKLFLNQEPVSKRLDLMLKKYLEACNDSER